MLSETGQLSAMDQSSLLNSSLDDTKQHEGADDKLNELVTLDNDAFGEAVVPVGDSVDQGPSASQSTNLESSRDVAVKEQTTSLPESKVWKILNRFFYFFVSVAQYSGLLTDTEKNP